MLAYLFVGCFACLFLVCFGLFGLLFESLVASLLVTLFVYFFVCLSVCLIVSLFVCLSVYLLVCLIVCLFTGLMCLWIVTVFIMPYCISLKVMVLVVQVLLRYVSLSSLCIFIMTIKFIHTHNTDNQLTSVTLLTLTHRFTTYSLSLCSNRLDLL